MTKKYSFVTVTSALKIISLLLVLLLAPLSNRCNIYAITASKEYESVSDPIINPGLDPTITLSSNSASLFAADKSTASVNVTSNATWSASSDASWLTVNPSSGTGNGTLTFTAEANNGGSRVAHVSVSAPGVQVQTIDVTQLQKVSDLTFSSSSSSSTTSPLSIKLQFSSTGTFYIDWGDGVLLAQQTSTSGNTYSSSSYIAGNIVKVYGSGITNLTASSQNLTSIVVSQCPDLTYLDLGHNNLTTLDVSANTNLTYLDASYNGLSSLDVSKNTLLSFLSAAYDNLILLDVSNNPALTTLNCISNEINSLDITKNSALTTLYCYSNNLIALDISQNKHLNYLYCNSNNLNFSTLPQPQSTSTYSTFSYAPQAKISAKVITNQVNLSSQYSVVDNNGVHQNTTYKWYTKNNTPLRKGVDYSELVGVFTFLNTPSDSVYCTMTNQAFKDFKGSNVLRTVNLKIFLITVTAVPDTKTYDGTTTSTASPKIEGLPADNFVNVAPIQVYDNANAGTTHILSASGLTIKNSSGVDVTSDYVITYVNSPATGTINAKQLTISTAPIINPVKAYDGNTSASVTKQGTLTGGIVTGDVVTLNSTASYDNANVGTGKTITITNSLIGFSAGNYYITTLNNTETDGVINAKLLTISAAPLINPVKYYDGTATAIVAQQGTLAAGIIAGDDVTLNSTASYNDANVGTGKTITVTNALVGSSVNNYYISTLSSTEIDGVINPKQLTVSGTTLNPDKVYNGNTSAAVILPGTLSGFEVGDDVSIQPVVATYDNANVGTGKTITVVYKLTGAAASKYSAPANYITTGNITPAGLTVTAVSDTRVYDGTTLSLGNPTVGTLVSGDVVNVSPVQNFDNANVGSRTLTASGLTLKNGNGDDVTGNYAITYSSVAGSITQASLNVTSVTDTKSYDGTTVSIGSPVVGTLAAGDVVNVSPVQVFDNSIVGPRTLTASGLTLKNGNGDDVTGNYNISYITSGGSITLANLTVTAVTETKIYDGTTVSTGIPIVGTLGAGDVVNVAPTQVFEDSSVGSHNLIASGLTIKNSNGDNATTNYTITYSPVGGNITQASLNVTAVSDTKTYDGTTLSTVIPTVGTLVSGDAVNIAPVQVFDNSIVGGRTLIPSGLTLKNGNGDNVTGNYNISYVTSGGSITPAGLTVTAVSDTRVYDGTTLSLGNPTVGTLVSGDVVNVSPVQSFDNANVGPRILTASGLTLKNGNGDDVTGNYTITYSSVAGSITQASLNVTSVTDIKSYDGTTVSTGSPVVGTLAAGDVVNVSPVQVFDNSIVGPRTLTASGLTLKNGNGDDVTGNYNISYITSGGSITQVALTVTAVTDTKTYDGTVVSAANPIVGTLVVGDVVNVAPIQAFDNAKVGNTHVMTASGLTLKNGNGDDVTLDYNITYSNSVTPGVILGKPLTAAAPILTSKKEYDGTTTAIVSPGILSGVDTGDDVSLIAAATYDNATVGNGKTITVTYGLTGSDAANYIVPSDYILLTGEITAKLLTITDPRITVGKEYDGTTKAFVTPGILSGLLQTDNANVVLSAVASYDDINIGTEKMITVTYVLTGPAAADYIAPSGYTITSGVITAKTLIVDSLKVSTTKVYDGTTSVTFSVGNLTGVAASDYGNVTVTGSAVYDNANAGSAKKINVTFNMTGSASDNYIVPSNYTITNGEITPKQLTISKPTVVSNKMYDGNTHAVITTLGSLQGVIPVDANNVSVTAAADYDNMNVGVNKIITVVYDLNGSAKDNYTAPVDYTLNGAEISDNISLSPLVDPSAGCEGSDLDLSYTVLTGVPAQYKITYNATAIAAGMKNVDYTNLPSSSTSGTLPVIIPAGTSDGAYQGTLQLRNDLGIESPVYTFKFTVNVSSDYIIPKFDDVVLCDNSSNRFVAYQWYKDGVAINGATKQFYCDANGLIGSYSLQVTTTDGQVLYTCPKTLNIQLTQKVSVFPSPVKVSQACTVKMTGLTDEELKGAVLKVYSMQGICVYQSTAVQRQNSISLPLVGGVYVGRVTTSNGHEFPFKIIVAQ